MKRIVLALRHAARILSGGVVAYPPKMYEEILAKVERQLLNWSLYYAENVVLKKGHEMLEILVPKESTEYPPPDFISPAVMKIGRQQADILLDLIDGKEPSIRIAKWSQTTNEEILKAFSFALSGRRNRIWTYDEKPAVKASPAHKPILKEIATAKKADGLSTEALSVLRAVLATAAMTAFSNAADTAVFRLDGYLRDRKAFEAKKKGASADSAVAETEEARALRKEIEDVERFIAFCKARGAVPENPTRARLRKKLGGVQVEWVQKADPTGLPRSYPTEAFDSEYQEITVRLHVAGTSVNGTWSNKEKALKLYVKRLPSSEDEFRTDLAKLGVTLQHELQHYVQYAIQASLRIRAEKTGKSTTTGGPERAGTPYSRRVHVPTIDTAEPADQGDEPGMTKRYAAIKRRYPDISDDEAYYLDPYEFFPQILSYAATFVKYVQKEARRGENVLDEWKNFVSLTDKGIVKSPFYEALKKYDKRLYRRAVAEGWVRVQKALESKGS